MTIQIPVMTPLAVDNKIDTVRQEENRQMAVSQLVMALYSSIEFKRRNQKWEMLEFDCNKFLKQFGVKV